MNECKEGTR